MGISIVAFQFQLHPFRLEGGKMMNPTLSFCESIYATTSSLWHIRILTEKGCKLNGGIDTESLCGKVRIGRGWDLRVRARVTLNHPSVCKECLKKVKG